MPKSDQKFVLAASIALVLLVIATTLYFGSNPERLARLLGVNQKPDIMLWAWEAPSDLRWANPEEIGVAYLASTITIYDDRIWIKPRMQPLKVAPKTYLTSVVRLECRRDKPPELSQKQMDSIVAQVLNQARVEGVRAVQIDFDARVSQRPFYRRLLAELKQKLPPKVELSMTALASWCIGDRWLKNTAADEVVPMFFSMGADNASVIQHLRAGRKIHDFDKEKAIGLSASSADVINVLSHGNGIETMKGRRLYLFSNKGWTRASAQQLLRKVRTI